VICLSKCFYTVLTFSFAQLGLALVDSFHTQGAVMLPGWVPASDVQIGLERRTDSVVVCASLALNLQVNLFLEAGPANHMQSACVSRTHIKKLLAAARPS
jgi:hypothetical protein